MKKNILITALLILGALAAIIFSFAIVGVDEKVNVKLQYTTQNILNPILEDLSIEELLPQKEYLCNINTIVEISSDEPEYWIRSDEFIGISSYKIWFFSQAIGDTIYFGKENIEYQGFKISSALFRGSEAPEVIYKVFPYLFLYNNSSGPNNSFGIGSFLLGAKVPGEFVIRVWVSSYRNAGGYPATYTASRRLGTIEARVYVLGEAERPITNQGADEGAYATPENGLNINIEQAVPDVDYGEYRNKEQLL